MRFRSAEDALSWWMQWRMRLASPSSSSVERLGKDRIVAGPTGGRGLDEIRGLVTDVGRCLDPGRKEPMKLEPLSEDERTVLIMTVLWHESDHEAVRRFSMMTGKRFSTSRLMSIQARAWRKFRRNLERLGLL